jgi:hypothetical protein
MLLGGTAPMERPQSCAGELFANLYGPYSVLTIVVTGIVFAPAVHRVFHKLSY